MKRDFDLPCSEKTILRVYSQHGLIKKRRRKHRVKNDLRAVKAAWPLFSHPKRQFGRGVGGDLILAQMSLGFWGFYQKATRNNIGGLIQIKNEFPAHNDAFPVKTHQL